MNIKDLCLSTLKACTRRKPLETSADINTDLQRCLSVLDLTFIGVGSTLGAGIYVLAGEVAKNKAGPAIIFSFLIAAVASFLSGLCYSEFGARFPKAGSAYAYCYVAMGEFCAFFIGWNIILEYVIGASAIVSGLTNYIDTLTSGAMRNSTVELVGEIHVDGLSPYFNFYAILFTVIFSVILLSGVKNSAVFNNILVALNITTISIVIVVGLAHSNFENWKNFAPFGVRGIVRGASTCFFAFIGFDVIATTGEEARNPGKSIPLSILLTIFICFIAYFGVSAALTLMVPYHELDSNAAVTAVFRQLNLIYMVYIVGAGATLGLLGCCLVSLMPPPRLLYAMAQDGLIPKIFCKVSQRTNVPVIGTIVSGILVGLMAAILNLDDLVEMLSIGTLLAYSIVDISVLVLRYRCPPIAPVYDEVSISELDCQLPSRPYLANELAKLRGSESLRNILIFMIILETIVISVMINKFGYKLIEKDAWVVIVFFFLGIFLIFNGMLLSRLPVITDNLSFTAPLVPWLPIVALLFNFSLMLELSRLTWIRFFAWMAIGMIIYFSFSMHHSIERQTSQTSGRSDYIPLLPQNDDENRTKNSPIEESNLLRSRNKVD